jgi:hypothetical protein
MIVCYQVEIDETETSLSIQELLDKGLMALTEAYSKIGCYYNIGYNPQLVIKGKVN